MFLLGQPRANVYRRTPRRSRLGLPSASSPWCSATPATTPGTGVAFTRNPPPAKALFGEYLIQHLGRGAWWPACAPFPISKLRGGDARGVVVRRHRRPPGEKHYWACRTWEFTIEWQTLYAADLAAAHRRRHPEGSRGSGGRYDHDEKGGCVPHQNPNNSTPYLPPCAGDPEGPGRSARPGRLPGAACGRVVFTAGRPRGGTSGTRRSSWSRLGRPLPRTSGHAGLRASLTVLTAA